jgi:hypothetical protein
MTDRKRPIWTSLSTRDQDRVLSMLRTLRIDTETIRTRTGEEDLSLNADLQAYVAAIEAALACLEETARAFGPVAAASTED